MNASDNLDHGVPGLVAGHSVLQRLIGIDRDRFAADYWGRQALLTEAAELPAPFADLLDAEAVDQLVSERGLRTPFLRVAKNGTTLADKMFTATRRSWRRHRRPGQRRQTRPAVRRRIDTGPASPAPSLAADHRSCASSWPAELGHPVQANAYVTPPQNQGFSDHYDVHDVFVLQIAGEKRWQIHAPVLEAPLRDQPWTDRKSAVERRARETPLIEAVLRPGDCLYLPRGFLHAANALGGMSIHLTIGVHVWTRYAIAEQLVGQALRTLAADPTAPALIADGSGLREPASHRATPSWSGTCWRTRSNAPSRPGFPGSARAARGTQRAAPWVRSGNSGTPASSTRTP